MAKAFIMVNTEPTETLRIGERLRAIRGAVIYEVFGPFDFIVDLEADTPEDLAGDASLQYSVIERSDHHVDLLSNVAARISQNNGDNISSPSGALMQRVTSCRACPRSG